MHSFSTRIGRFAIGLAFGAALGLGAVAAPAGTAHADPNHPPRAAGPTRGNAATSAAGNGTVAGQPGSGAGRPFLTSSPGGPIYVGVIMANTEGDFHLK